MGPFDVGISTLKSDRFFAVAEAAQVDFMVRTWGWKGVKDLIATRGQDPTVLGVVDKADFMTRYYADYDQIWNQ